MDDSATNYMRVLETRCDELEEILQGIIDSKDEATTASWTEKAKAALSWE